jgi:Kdo2-lipid IVA lauroyltransferase/acyltransferase
MSSLLFYILFAFIWLFSWIPFWILYRISDLLYLIVFYMVRYRKKTVIHNIRTSFPEKTEKEVMQMTKLFYRHFCDFLLEMSKCIRISPGQLDKHMKFINPEVFEELAQENRNFALVSSHYNNWEWLITLPIKMKHRFLVIYRPLENKAFDRLVMCLRGRHKPVMTPMESIFREGVKCRSENTLFSIWFLADQRPPRSTKFWTRFLNHDVAFFEGVEKLSRKLNLAVVFMDVQKVKRGYYEVRLKRLIDNAAQTNENEVTLACVKEMEEEILKRPEFWLWSHKRFKHTRPENVKLVIS